MNLKELSKVLAVRNEVSASVAYKLLSGFFDELRARYMAAKGLSTKGGDLRSLRLIVNKFGSFYPLQLRARTGRNPNGGQTLRIPAKLVVRFKPSAALVGAIN